jgi:hypothetical protein
MIKIFFIVFSFMERETNGWLRRQFQWNLHKQRPGHMRPERGSRKDRSEMAAATAHADRLRTACEADHAEPQHGRFEMKRYGGTGKFRATARGDGWKITAWPNELLERFELARP